MKKVSYLLIVITLGFLFNLAKEETFRFDILNTKNDHLLQFKKAEVDSMTNLIEVKEFAKKGLEINRDNFKKNRLRLGITFTYL